MSISDSDKTEPNIEESGSELPIDEGVPITVDPKNGTEQNNNLNR